MGGKKALHFITFTLLVIGGLNWLLVGVFKWDIGALFGGVESVISRIIYILVGLSALYALFAHKGDCKMCGMSGGMGGGMGQGKM